MIERLKKLFGGGGTDGVRVHVILRGRIGDTWLDVDETLRVPPDTTLTGFIALAGKRGIPLADAIANSPHLAHTLMINGERHPVDESGDRVMTDGDELYLLAPIAGG